MVQSAQCNRIRPKLHYTDAGYEHVVQHHQRTPPTDELTTILQQICHIAMPEPNISTGFFGFPEFRVSSTLFYRHKTLSFIHDAISADST